MSEPNAIERLRETPFLWNQETERQATDAALAAVDALYQAAGPMARLPFPVSSDERDDWRVYQQRLAAAVRRVEGQA